MSTFTILIGSAGRDSLRHTLDSILRQERVPGDQVIISFDAFEKSEDHVQYLVDFVESYGEGFIATAYDSGYHWLGVEQINHAMRIVPITGSHVFTIGDDDIFVDGAYATLRPYCDAEPLRPILYRFMTPRKIGRQLLWDTPRFAPCFISGCCIAAPRRYVREMHTRLETTHDYDWMKDAIDRSGVEPLYLDYVGVIADPDERGNDVVHAGVWHCACGRWKWKEDATGNHCECGKKVDDSPRVVT